MKAKQEVVFFTPLTGLYFNGTCFNGSKAEALRFERGTATLEQFRFIWGCHVEMQAV